MTLPAATSALRDLPGPADRRLAVRVTRDALRQVRGGHPWVFAGSVTSVSGDGDAGDLAVVFDEARRFAAIGLYDPDSPLRIRILHAGGPTPIDDDWWRHVVDSALVRRRVFTDAADGDRLGYRVLNGESDGTPGLVADRYAGVLVVKLDTAAWFPHLLSVTDALLGATGCGAVVLRLARSVAAPDGLADGDVVAGDLPDGPVRFVENGLAFDADVRSGQKTGHFLDQRANRRRVRELASGRDVLDVFASTGGFTVHAAAGGARSVHAVDSSRPTLAAAQHNLAINGDDDAIRRCRVTFEVGDAFEVMERLGAERRRFDLVVVDPPSFARRRSEVERGLRAYGRLTRSAVLLMRAGGMLVQASCSSRIGAAEFFGAVPRAAARAGCRLVEVDRTGHDADHPVTFPEGAYLKAGFWRVERI
jgi:23S rRNA (cytosine1962-C5)-methyltransferase